MGTGLLVTFFLGIIILVCSPLSYFAFKKIGKRKTGIVIASILGLIVLIPIFMTVFEGNLYFKSDAKEDLKLVNIVLNDDFEIISSKISGMPEYYQNTELKISKKDNLRIIEQIKHSLDFEKYSQYSDLMTTVYEYRTSIDSNYTKFWNRQSGGIFSRGYFKDVKGIVPVKMTIDLSLNSDTLFIHRIED
jgi:energy-coupling factor transporter transmembrane protein EcfT